MPEEPCKNDAAMGLLRAFGLDRVLTDRDDPELWAAALERHWHAPGEAELQPETLRFRVSRAVRDDEAGAANVARSGMVVAEEWCFERLATDQLRVVECQEQQAPSFMSMLMAGEPLATAGAGSWVRDYLEVSRPSVDASEAMVHAGMSAPPNAGSGETRAWVRADDGTWVETGEVLARWLA